MLKIVAFSLVALLLGWLSIEAVDNFQLRYIFLNHWPTVVQSVSEECERASSDLDDVRQILDQPFFYFGKGRQFYVFVSKDGKYVLKCIKCQRFNITPLWEKIPLFKEQTARRLERKRASIERLFSSCHLASHTLADLTGVIFTHLRSLPEVRKNVTLVDRLGWQHTLDIDQVPFVLQYRAEKIIPTLERLKVEGDTAGIYRRLDQLALLFFNLASRHVIDLDGGIFVRDNLGFLQEKAIFVDIGTFVYSDKSEEQENLKKLSSFVEWLETQDREFANYFVKKMIYDSN